jgi:hypothetical protein
VTEKYQPQVSQGPTAPEMEPIGTVSVMMAGRPGTAYLPIDRCTRCHAVVPTEYAAGHQEYHMNLQALRLDIQAILHNLNDRIPNA